MRPNPFMDEVGIEVVGQGEIGNRGVTLCTFGNDLGLDGLGVGVTGLWIQLAPSGWLPPKSERQKTAFHCRATAI
jgi:hypothetical protein